MNLNNFNLVKSCLHKTKHYNKFICDPSNFNKDKYKVIPIYKNGPNDIFSTYISILPVFLKSLKSVYNRLEIYLSMSEILTLWTPEAGVPEKRYITATARIRYTVCTVINATG